MYYSVPIYVQTKWQHKVNVRLMYEKFLKIGATVLCAVKKQSVPIWLINTIEAGEYLATVLAEKVGKIHANVRDCLPQWRLNFK